MFFESSVGPCVQYFSGHFLCRRASVLYLCNGAIKIARALFICLEGGELFL